MPTEITDPGSSKYYTVPVNQRIFSQVNKDCWLACQLKISSPRSTCCIHFAQRLIEPCTVATPPSTCKKPYFQWCWHVAAFRWHKSSDQSKKLGFIPSIWPQATQWLLRKIESKKVACKGGTKDLPTLILYQAKKVRLFYVRERTMELNIRQNTSCDVI